MALIAGDSTLAARRVLHRKRRRLWSVPEAREAAVARSPVIPNAKNTSTEIRLVFRRPPRRAFMSYKGRPPADGQLVIKLDPTTAVGLQLDAQRADIGGRQAITLDMEFAQEGGERPAANEAVLYAAMQGDSTPLTRQGSVEETWRTMAPPLETPPPVHASALASWGPVHGEQLLADVGDWHDPWPSA